LLCSPVAPAGSGIEETGTSLQQIEEKKEQQNRDSDDHINIK
jgi:hypothetical protein